MKSICFSGETSVEAYPTKPSESCWGQENDPEEVNIVAFLRDARTFEFLIQLQGLRLKKAVSCIWDFKLTTFGNFKLALSLQHEYPAFGFWGHNW